jgi:hypothetical protein
MDWDLGSSGLLYLAAMSIGFGLLAQLLSGRAARNGCGHSYQASTSGVGILVSEFWVRIGD